MNEDLIPVSKGGEYLEVNRVALLQHKQLGWTECARQEVKEALAAKKPSDGLTVEKVKEALAANGVEIPEGVTLKADLAALLDAS
jgi:hypothetical protein